MVTLPLFKQFRFKLAAAYILLITSVIAISGVSSYQAAENEFRKLLFEEFQSTRNVTNNFLKFVEQTAFITARSVAADNELLTILATNDTKALALRLGDLVDQNASDIITLLDHNGRVLARGHEPESFGDSLLAFDFVVDLRKGQETITAIVQDQSSFILYSTAALRHPGTDKPVYILAGYALNNTFVDHIQENNRIEVSLVRERSVISTTLHTNGKRINTLPIPFLEYELLLANPDQVIEAHFLGRDYYISAERLPLMQENMAGSMLLSHSQEELTTILKQLTVRFFFIFMTSLIVGVAIIIFFTGKMLQPVQQLIQKTQQISDGDLQSRINLKSQDEFSLLGKHFDVMADTIEKRDAALKEYSHNLEEQVKERTNKIVEQSNLISNVLRSSRELAIVITNTDQKIQHFNPVAEILFECKAEDVLGHNIQDLHSLTNTVRNDFNKAMAVVKKKGACNFDLTQQREGTTHYFELSVTTIRDTTGVFNGFVLMAMDVTKRKKMEQHILDNRKLESFRVLAGGLAHDFNNLLQVILGGVSYARTLSKTDEGLDPVLLEIEHASEQAAQLSKAMLTISQGGHHPVKPYRLRRLLETESAKVETDIIHCETNLDTDLWLISGNEELLEEVIRTVFGNASDAMTEGGTLTITARNLQSDQETDLPLGDCNRIEVVIADTGIGISTQNMDQIFDPYFSTKERGVQKGMGLGLATTMAIINKHDGHISVQSEEGHGTTVSLYFPALV